MGKNLNGRELGEGISQMKDGRYRARYTDKSGKRQCVYGRTEREIKAKLAEKKVNGKKVNELNTDFAVLKTVTVDEWFDEWMETYKSKEIRLDTKKYYVSAYRRLISPETGGRNIDTVRPLDVQKLLNELESKGYSYNMRCTVKSILKDMFERAQDNSLVNSNPAVSARLGKDNKKEPRVLSLDEQEAFFRCSAGTFYDGLFRTAIYTGLRPGELTALTLDDIDFDNSFIKVTKTLVYQKLEGDEKIQLHVGPPKTDSSIRDVPISNDLLPYLAAQVKQSKNVRQRRGTNNQYLFVNPYGRPISPKCYSEAILRIVKEINSQRAVDEEIPQFHAHTFRHTFATRCLENGISPKTLQAYLGHATLNTTMDKYVHVLPDFKKQEIDKMQLDLF